MQDKEVEKKNKIEIAKRSIGVVLYLGLCGAGLYRLIAFGFPTSMVRDTMISSWLLLAVFAASLAFGIYKNRLEGATRVLALAVAAMSIWVLSEWFVLDSFTVIILGFVVSVICQKWRWLAYFIVGAVLAGLSIVLSTGDYMLAIEVCAPVIVLLLCALVLDLILSPSTSGD